MTRQTAAGLRGLKPPADGGMQVGRTLERAPRRHIESAFPFEVAGPRFVHRALALEHERLTDFARTQCPAQDVEIVCVPSDTEYRLAPFVVRISWT